MSKNTMTTVRDRKSRTKLSSSTSGDTDTGAAAPDVEDPAGVRPKASKPKGTKMGAAKPKTQPSKTIERKTRTPRQSKPKSGPVKTAPKPSSEATVATPAKAAVKRSAKAVAKVATKSKAKPAGRPASKVAASKTVSAKPISPAKPATQQQTKPKAVESAGPPLGTSLEAAVPAAVAVNTKLVDIAHANVSASLELARDLVHAKTPMEAMRLGVAYWLGHLGAVQAQARELQSLSAEWMRSAGENNRAD